MTPRRWCFLTTFYPPFNFGGDGIDVQRTARALARRGHQVTVIHDIDAYEWVSGSRGLEPSSADDGVEVVGLKSGLGMLSPLLTHQLGRPVAHGRAIASLIQARGTDVIVFNNMSLVGGPGLLSVPSTALKVYVAHEHWLICPTHVLWKFNREPCDGRACLSCVLRHRRPPQMWRYTGAIARHAADVDLFIARSEFSRTKHREFGFERPMSVLPYFVPGEMAAEPALPTGPRPHERPYFLYVGRLTRLKGLDAILPAFARYADADCLIVGDGEEERALRAQAAGNPRVRFVGRVPNDRLGPFYAHAIAALAPSRGYETFGLVIIEAFQNGTPVIARGIGPFPEIVNTSGGGVLFEDEAGLLAAMTRLQHDAAGRQAMAVNGYRACRQHWSEDVVIDRFLAMVDEASVVRGPDRAESNDGAGR